MNLGTPKVLAAVHGFLVLTGVLLLPGCASIGGYRLTEEEGGDLNLQNVKGIPIAVQVPTHAMFVVKVETYGVYDVAPAALPGGGAAPLPGAVPAGSPGQIMTRRPNSIVRMTVVNEQPILLGAAQMYSLDLKRPAAGKIDYDIDLENYYPTKIKALVEDSTIETISEAISRQVQDFLSLQSGGVAGGGEELQSGGAAVVERLESVETKFLVMELANPGATAQFVP